MQEIDILMTLAELALALVGFTGIVLALGRRESGLGPVDVYRAIALTTTAGGALALALLPVGLFELGLEEPTVWRAGSASMVAYTMLWFAGTVPMARRVEPNFGAARQRLVVLPISIVNIIAQVLNAWGAFEHAFGVYFAGLSWHLIGSLVAFLLFLVRPAE